MLQLIYNQKSDQKIYEYLKNRESYKFDRMFENSVEIYDYTTKKEINVSIIVSIYNGAEKINTFLSQLKNVIIKSVAEVEIILVETGSESNDVDEFKKYEGKNDIEIKYIKYGKRETIQSAWNRGIGHSRGKYLCFLGLDESLYANAIDTLFYELENNPTVDWVIGNSIMINVDNHGNYIN